MKRLRNNDSHDDLEEMVNNVLESKLDDHLEDMKLQLESRMEQLMQDFFVRHASLKPDAIAGSSISKSIDDTIGLSDGQVMDLLSEQVLQHAASKFT